MNLSIFTDSLFISNNIKMNLTLKNTFAKIALLTYCLGTIGHIMTIVFRPPIDQMPTIAHGTVMVLAGYAALGFILNRKKMVFKNLADKFIYGLILFHLTMSALVHAYSIIFSTNEWLNVFNPSYNYLAIIYFASFAYYSFKLDKRLSN